MTDEEMAEKYVKNRYGTLCVSGANALQEAFLAGLKAGRLEWHDLRKDKNDLSSTRNSIVSDTVLDQDGNSWYNYKDK